MFPFPIYTQSAAAPIDGVTFASAGPTLFAPVREVAKAVGLTLSFSKSTLLINGVPAEETRTLPDGTRLLPVRLFAKYGAAVIWSPETLTATVTRGENSAEVIWADKHVVVDKSRQVLEAYQGTRLVLTTHISSGRAGHNTPNGQFEAGPVKERMHRSRLYDNSPMPWSVQVDGDIFVHGYESVPRVPASHGCIRLPLDGINPAKWFYDWVDIGTPIEITGEWGN